MVELHVANRPARDFIGGVALTEGPARGRMILRGVEAIRPAASVLGFDLPTRAMTTCSGQGRSALWLGPDEWLLLVPSADSDLVQQALQTALAATPHSLVDVSHRQVSLQVEGPGATLCLAMGVPLDLATAALPIGSCARTIFEKAEIVLWRRDVDTFHIEVWRSFAAYVRALLDLARHEAA